jgi:hypothetical protein
MLARYLEIKKIFPQLHFKEIDDILPNSCQDREITVLTTMLCNLNLVTFCLQNENTTLADVHTLFDIVIKEYLESQKRLGSKADIVQDKEFESAVVKVLEGLEVKLTSNKDASVWFLLQRGQQRNNASLLLTHHLPFWV